MSGVFRKSLVAMRGVVLPLVALSMGACGGSSPVRATPSDDPYAVLARGVFDESNSLRVNPAMYAGMLEQSQNHFSGKIYYREHNPVGIMTNEGVAAVKEAVEVLESQSALQPLQWSESLAELAHAHVMDTGALGLVGHEGTDGKIFKKRVEGILHSGTIQAVGENIAYGPDNGREVVLQLVVDDGVASRGHRDNMLKAKFNASGVGCGYHLKYNTICVVVYGTLR